MNENNILNVDLYSIGDGGTGDIFIPDSSKDSGVEVQSRRHGQFEYIYPDGETVICDKNGNIIG